MTPVFWHICTDVSEDPAASIIGQWWIDCYDSLTVIMMTSVSSKSLYVPIQLHGVTFYMSVIFKVMYVSVYVIVCTVPQAEQARWCTY
jgi:hypothetical protein